MSTSRWVWTWAMVCVFVTWLVPSVHAAPGDTITMADASIATSRGIAADRASQVYWLAPAADQPQVTAIGADGQIAGQVGFDATPSEIEALSYANDHLYVGDIGDAAQSRSSIMVYRIEFLQYGVSVSYSMWTLSYPDGPHQAKAMLVSPRGNIYIVTYGAPGGIYLAEVAGQFASSVELVRVADAPNWVTDAVFTDEGNAAMRSYTGVTMVNMHDFTFTAQGRAPAQAAGEGLSLALSGGGLMTSSVGSGELTEMAIPTTWDDSVPPANSQPPGEGAQESSVEPEESAEQPGAEPSDGAEPPKEDAPSFHLPSWMTSRTFWAVVIAGVGALSIGWLAYLLPGMAPELKRHSRRTTE